MNTVLNITRRTNIVVLGKHGSGKTSVCVRAALETLRRGKNVVYLAPYEKFETVDDIFYSTHSSVTKTGRYGLLSMFLDGNVYVLLAKLKRHLEEYHTDFLIIDDIPLSKYECEAIISEFNKMSLSKGFSTLYTSSDTSAMKLRLTREASELYVIEENGGILYGNVPMSQCYCRWPLPSFDSCDPIQRRITSGDGDQFTVFIN